MKPFGAQRRALECGQAARAEVAFAEPLLHRRAEALLAAVDHVVVEIRLGGLLQHALADAVAQLVGRRQPRREVDDVVIEERHACLDRMRHGQLVDAHQQMLRTGEASSPGTASSAAASGSSSRPSSGAEVSRTTA